MGKIEQYFQGGTVSFAKPPRLKNITHPNDSLDSQDTQGSAELEELQKALAAAARLLPAQGPLSVFVHHNTLHALEDLSFELALLKARELLHCEPYKPESWYRDEYLRGRIKDQDLVAVVDLESPALEGSSGGPGPISLRELRLALLRYDLHEVEGAQLRWHLNETRALQRFRREIDPAVRKKLQADCLAWVRQRMKEAPLRAVVDSFPDDWSSLPFEELLKHHPRLAAIHVLWTACHRAVLAQRLEARPPRQATGQRLFRHRDFAVKAGFADPDALVHPLLVRLCAGFLDQGFADVEMPGRELGLYRCFRHLYSLGGVLQTVWMGGLKEVLSEEERRNDSSTESVLASLASLGVEPPEWEDYIRDTLLALKGWAGMIYQAQVRPDRLPVERVPADLMDFLAVRLLLDRFALAYRVGPGPDEIRQAPPQLGDPTMDEAESGSFKLFQVAQFCGISPEHISQWEPRQTCELLEQIESFGDLERRRLFHLAYERRLRVITLDALSLHEPRSWSAAHEGEVPEFQAIFCLDEREESTRRHLEEIAPGCETFGTLGYFGIPMYFKAIHEPHPLALCPVSIRPAHLVVEVVNESSQQEAERLASIRRSIGQVTYRVQAGSQTLTWGVLFPRAAGRFGKSIRRRLLPSDTRLEIMRQTDRLENGLLLGFSEEEMADIVGGLLEDIGLTRGFSRLVLVVGHGSSSLNNPHEAAYDCGACGGGRGGPNARVFAWMANHPGVRARVAERGVVIPADTRFVGAYHNTCDDEVDLYELESLGPEQLADLERAVLAFNRARANDAVERCRRFESAPFELTPQLALKHVEARSEDLAQPRPELGHATNALCIVGRRRRTRGLFLDRRAFLVSYDPSLDDEQGTVLGRVLRAAAPVGAGINLEYYFSNVDNLGYGCGTKLPHNITSLLGVMDGHTSDLRTGLPWQMVEIHEPVRLLVVLETRRSVIEAVLEREAGVRRLVTNRWIQVALLDPDSQKIELLKKSGWIDYHPEIEELPVVTTSSEWFYHHREHLRFAEIRSEEIPCSPN